MAYHFSANQYEDQYSPRKLGNWEYPKWYPERPRQRFKSTKIIADDNGRLLDGIKRENPWGNYVGTWDLPRRITREYVKKIVSPPERLVKLWAKKKKEPPQPQPTQEEAPEKEEKTEHLPNLDQNGNSSSQKSFERRNKSSSALDLRPRTTKLEPLANLEEKKENLHNIKPGDLDEKIKKILESVQNTPKSPPQLNAFCKEIKAIPRRTRQKIDKIRPQKIETKPKEEEEHAFLNGLDDHLSKYETVPEFLEETEQEIDLNQTEGEKPDLKTPPTMREEKKSATPTKPETPSYQIAKKFHEENLKHKPLPDVIDDPVYKALNSSRQPNAGASLNVQPTPSAIGWKYYTAPGPTECSKLKVYRPKTAADKVKPQKETRPKTGSSTGGLTKRFLPIDLAICWDLKPDDPADEPKRSPHIDGSNGSVAPAVFTMIRPMSEPDEENVQISNSPQAVAEKIRKGIDENNVATLPSQLSGKPRSPVSMVTNKEAIMTCIRSPQETRQKQKNDTPNSINSISTNAAEYARKNPKTAWTNEDTSKALSNRLFSLQKGNEKGLGEERTPGSAQMRKKQHHQSTPNLATACSGSHCGTEKGSPGSKGSNCSRSPNVCNGNGCGSGSVERKSCDSLKPLKNGHKKNRNCSACDKSKSDFEDNREKTEFKSAFKAGVPKSESSNSGTSCGAKYYKAPKMRLPYAKKSYSIGTLAPPFSLWRENNGQEYPEHWRLASVYQHSYKPINSRKRPLLASVYQ